MCLSATVCSVKMLMSVSALNLKLFYISVKFSECQICMIRDKYFDCNQKKHQHKNCLTNSYSKIHQAITFNENEQAVSFRKTYITFMTSSKMSNKKHSTFFHVVTSHIMSSDESENKLF